MNFDNRKTYGPLCAYCINARAYEYLTQPVTTGAISFFIFIYNAI